MINLDELYRNNCLALNCKSHEILDYQEFSENLKGTRFDKHCYYEYQYSIIKHINLLPNDHFSFNFVYFILYGKRLCMIESFFAQSICFLTKILVSKDRLIKLSY